MKDSEQKQANEQFPSTHFLINAYSLGALFTLFAVFILPLDKQQQSACLFLGWILAIGAIAISMQIFSESKNEDEY